MEQITLRIDAETLEELENEAEEQDTSRSEYIRDVLESRNDHDSNTDELRERIEKLQTDLERVQREKRMILEEREEKQELVRYVEDERSAEQRWREAALTKRLKWRVFGMPSEER